MRRNAFPKLRLIFYSELWHPNPLLNNDSNRNGTGPDCANSLILNSIYLCISQGKQEAYPLQIWGIWWEMKNDDKILFYPPSSLPVPAAVARGASALVALAASPRAGHSRWAQAAAGSAAVKMTGETLQPPQICWLMDHSFVQGK